MLEKIKSGFYKAKLLKKKLCYVSIIVWNNEEPKSIENIEYEEYEEIKSYLIA